MALTISQIDELTSSIPQRGTDALKEFIGALGRLPKDEQVRLLRQIATQAAMNVTPTMPDDAIDILNWKMPRWGC